MQPSALITGVTGQDGVLLARRLVESGYRVVGTRQPGSSDAFLPYLSDVQVCSHDVRDVSNFQHLLGEHAPGEVYNLAGFSSVGASWNQPELVNQVNAVAVEAMLGSLVTSVSSSGSAVKFFQPSSSEMFGTDAASPADENTPHNPASPYARSKSHAHQSIVRYRDRADLFACTGILFNHESALRGRTFVTRKIVRAAAEIATGKAGSVTLGNLAISRDWGSAKEYVAAMHAAMLADSPRDYVIATGTSHTLAELLEFAFGAAGLSDPWSYVEQDPALLRTSDAPGLVGNPQRAADELGWTAQMAFRDLVTEMVLMDIARLESGVEEDPRYLA